MSWKFLLEYVPNFEFPTITSKGMVIFFLSLFLLWCVLSLSTTNMTEREKKALVKSLKSRFKSIVYIFCLGLLFFSIAYISYGELTLSPERRVERAESIYQAEKKAIEDAHEYELREAQAQVKLAEIAAKQRALYDGDSATKIEHIKRLTKAKANLRSLQTKGADYSKLSQATISSSKSEPVGEQTKLVLSALWLGACFFLQRLFEKLFKDKGYALLTVCAAGFLLAFFTANYFLLGGSVTGGIMGSVGDRA